MFRRAAISLLFVAILFAVASCSDNDSTSPKGSAPTVKIANPWNDTYRFGDVEVSVDATDDTGISQVDLYVNDTLLGTDKEAPFAFTWDMSSLADGSVNKLYARAVDLSGRATISSTVSVTKKVTAFPVATLKKPVTGSSYVQGDKVSFEVSVTDADTSDATFDDDNIVWTSDLQGLLGTGAKLDHRGLVIGTHTITMTATDSNGMSDVKTLKVTVGDNSLSYATIEAGKYKISGPVFTDHEIQIEKAFYISKTEMTIKEFLTALKVDSAWLKARKQLLVGTTKYPGIYPDLFECSSTSPITPIYPDYPAVFITFKEAVEVCNNLSDANVPKLKRAYIYLDASGNEITAISKARRILYDYTANGWRLPGEAEWEIAARGGFVGKKYPWGDEGPGSLANSMSESPVPLGTLPLVNGKGLMPVKSYAPNRYGLYNAVGNAAEMTTDEFTGTPPEGSGNSLNYGTTSRSALYLCKGGAWYQYGANLQIGIRDMLIAYNVSGDKRAYNIGIGMRLVRFVE